MTELADSPARDRIATDTAATLFVEAGAGSGKTSALVRRITTLVLTDRIPLSAIAAVTFTEKAGAELRDRRRVDRDAALVRATASDDAPDRGRAAAADRRTRRGRLVGGVRGTLGRAAAAAAGRRRDRAAAAARDGGRGGAQARPVARPAVRQRVGPDRRPGAGRGAGGGGDAGRGAAGGRGGADRGAARGLHRPVGQAAAEGRGDPRLRAAARRRARRRDPDHRAARGARPQVRARPEGELARYRTAAVGLSRARRAGDGAGGRGARHLPATAGRLGGASGAGVGRAAPGRGAVGVPRPAGPVP